MAQTLGLEAPLLVVCPAMARQVWKRQVETWWPARAADVAVIEIGEQRKTQTNQSRKGWQAQLARRVRVVSPGLLDVVRETALLSQPNAMVIIDEVHSYGNPASQQSIALREVLKNHTGLRAALSGTLIPNRLAGLWNPLDLMWPGRFGVGSARADGTPRVPFGFLMRYLEREWGKYGTSWGAQRQDTAAELRYRLSELSSRITRTEIAHLLPPCQVRPLPVVTETGKAAWLPWLEEAALGVHHMVLLFHRRASVHAAVKQLSFRRAIEGWVIRGITGADTPMARGKAIEEVYCASPGILISTMHAVKESIDLSWAERILLAELYWRPATLTQVIGRFGRPGGVPSILDVLCQAGSVYERMASVVADKLYDIATTMPKGQTEAALHGALAPPVGLEELTRVALSVVINDELLDEVEEDEL